MAVAGSVHMADVGLARALGLLRSAPRPGSIEGLRHADVALAAPLRTKSLPHPDPRRVALIAFWEDDQALDHFLLEHPLATKLADGWHTRLEPLRAFGAWPGLPEDLERRRETPYD